MLELCLRPRVTIPSFETFVETHRPYSIAIDGYVEDESRWQLKTADHEGPYLNLDHHAKVNRSSTRSTCAQAHYHMKLRILERLGFLKENFLQGTVFANHCDEDVCKTWWLLSHPEWFETRRTPPLLVDALHLEDALDTTCGAYPFDIYSNRLKRMFWIYQAYNEAKVAGILPRMDAAGMRKIVNEVGRRIDEYVAGRAEMIEPDTRYECLDQGDGWIMIKEVGAQARSYLFREEGKQLIITALRINGNFEYRVIKQVPYVDLNSAGLARRLNQMEGSLITPTNKWGQSDLFVVSPRETGSSLPPDILKEEVFKFVGPLFWETIHLPKGSPEPTDRELGDWDYYTRLDAGSRH